MTSEDKAVLVQLELSLRAVGNALARANLERLLTAEPELATALDAVARLQPGSLDWEARVAIDAARSSLLRCRRLGAALLEFTRISLDPTGQSGYSRTGMVPGTAQAGTASAAAVGPTLEARG